MFIIIPLNQKISVMVELDVPGGLFQAMVPVSGGVGVRRFSRSMEEGLLLNIMPWGVRFVPPLAELNWMSGCELEIDSTELC